MSVQEQAIAPEALRSAMMRVIRRRRIAGAHGDANALWALRDRLPDALARALTEEAHERTKEVGDASV
jgi:hypothetical protein